MSIGKLMRFTSLILLLVIVINIAMPFVNLTNAQQEKIYVAFIWHYHQPWYYSPDETYFVLPWVRMHSVGNYYKMAYILSKYPGVRVTFTFSGSLLEQIVDYADNGKMDLREIISWRIVNNTVSVQDVFNMLRIPGGFFDINWARIVDRSPRYSELRDLAQSINRNCSLIAKSDEELIECVVKGFTGGNLLSQNVIDLAVLFNLLWIDPQVAREKYPDIHGLMNAAYTRRQPNFTIANLTRVLSVHKEIMRDLLPLYRELISKSQIEVIPVPYSHPLAPIIVDSGLMDDLEMHVKFSMNLFRQYLNTTPIGVWPAEQAVNEYVVEAFRRAGINWTVTDSTVLAATGANPGNIEDLGVPWYIDFAEGRIHIFFRELEISNRVSFQYSGWDQDQAVNDLVNRIMAYRSSARGPRIVVIALDGENPWEQYPEFGTVFLNKLYAKLSELQSQGVLETITPAEFLSRFPQVARQLPQKTYRYLDLAGRDISDIPSNSYGDGYSLLPRKDVTARLPEGSWGGGEVAIWLGHRQENVAHMWMIKAREDILNKLAVRSLSELYNRNPDMAKYLLRSQASDWWWWYGGDGGGSPATFDPLFKAYLRRAYELAGLTPPDYLKVSAYPDGTPIGTINQAPPGLADKPIVLDGLIEDTWFRLLDDNKALKIPIASIVPYSLVAIDSSKLYFAFTINYTNIDEIKIAVYFATPSIKMSPYGPEYNIYPRNRNIDLGIHLARELLINPTQKNASIYFADGKGGWRLNKTITNVYSVISPGNTTVEVAVNTTDLGLAFGEPAYIAIVVYKNMMLEEWSSRLGLAYVVSIPTPPPEIIGTVLAEIEDPVEDDNGIGSLVYPTDVVFKPGVFDLTKFTVIDVGDSYIFKFQFRELGGNPWGGPNGWSLQQIHMYVKTTLADAGNTTTFGLNVMISHGWHMAIVIAPGWGTDPIPTGQRSGIYYYDKANPLVQDGKLRTYADQARKEIIAQVSKDALYDPSNIDKWYVVIAVASHDGYGPNMIRPIQAGSPGQWVFGGADPVAILAGVHPYIIDLLAPTKEAQYQALRSYNTSAKTLASISGLKIGDYIVQQPVSPTPTTTPTSTPTASPSPSLSPTPTQSPLPTQSPSPTPTQSPTITTPTQTNTLTQPITSSPTASPSPSLSPTPTQSPLPTQSPSPVSTQSPITPSTSIPTTTETTAQTPITTPSQQTTTPLPSMEQPADYTWLIGVGVIIVVVIGVLVFFVIKRR